MVESEGAYVFDAQGNKYLDGIAGLWCVNIGYGRKEMGKAMADQAALIPYYSTFGNLTTPPAAELSAKLANLAPCLAVVLGWSRLENGAARFVRL